MIGLQVYVALALAARTVRAAKVAMRDPAIPRPLRWLAAFALLPIPGPVDEVAAVIVLAALALAYRPRMRAAWQAAAPAPDGGRPHP